MSMEHATPRLMVVDPRYLPVRSVDYCRIGSGPTQRRINRSLFDTAGRAVKQWDPRLWPLHQDDESVPANLSTVYSLSDARLFTLSVDAGRRIDLPGLAGEGLRSWDGRGTKREAAYDDSLRPVAVFEQGAGQPFRCVERMTYGYPGQGNSDHNQYGQLIRHDDPAGSVLLSSFALAGQNLELDRRFVLDAALPDWPAEEADRESLLEPGEGARSTWRRGPQGDLLEQIDARGNRLRQALTLDGRLASSQLLLQGQSQWQPLVSDIGYNAEGQVEREMAGNGVQTTLTYSPEDGRLMQRLARRGGQVLQHLVYAYDPVGNVLGIEDKALPVRYFANQRIEPISRFTYDTLYQLTEATGWEAGSANQGPESVGRNDPSAVSNYRQTYRYDDSGNLLELTHVGAQNHGHRMKAARYSNRCLSYRDDVPPTEEEIDAAFDARGNRLELEGGRLLAWDLRNQLGSVTPVERASGLNDGETYVYAGDGQRARKLRTLQTRTRTLATEVRYLPGLELRADSGSGESLQVITAQGGLNSVRVLHWESTPPSGVNDQYRYSFSDHLGSVGLELDHDGRIISQEHFYPFGETAYLVGDDMIEVSYKTVRYSGKERDATGLYYYGLRYYMPWLQRWVNPDPAGEVDGLNIYAMVGNNPATFLDWDGGTKGQLNGGGVAENEKISIKERAAMFGAARAERTERRAAEKPDVIAFPSSGKSVQGPPPIFGNHLLDQVKATKPASNTAAETQKVERRGTGINEISTSDVSISFKDVTITRNRMEVAVQRLTVTFHRAFDLVEGKSVPQWPSGYELLPSQDWANEEGIKEYEKFHVLEGTEREGAVALIKTKSPQALKVGLGTPTFAYDRDARIITLKDGHHRFIAAARLGRTIELDSSRVPTSNLRWKGLKYSVKKPVKV
ncbi:RHS repeat protein [Pseudomonas sp. AF32]|uniref:RHS repeat domain-containing protein n=1 Tax=Pseudomonas sp. AF32 TaxID=554390 RepID=UPI001EED889D|nr:RHS repeat-associated core domain-containing protein [Pseudomonas sp. AF32]MCG6575371.1 RHS repeat protein [Pseudomonas sp. AF32]